MNSFLEEPGAVLRRNGCSRSSLQIGHIKHTMQLKSSKEMDPRLHGE